MAAELGISKIVIETDSMLVKSALETTSFALAVTGSIVFEIKSFISTYFDSCLVSFRHRECNRVAHALAAQGCTCPQHAVLLWDGTPPGVEDLVGSDVTDPLS
jgi:hypothetical protein